MKLYEIDNALMEAFDEAIDQETGEIVNDEAYERLCDLQTDRDAKIENIGLWVKNLLAEAAAIREEEKALAKRRNAIEKKVEWLKDFLSYATGGNKFETARLCVSFRSTTSVEINVPASQIPSDLLRWKDPEPDKALIKEALKQGKQIDGCELVTRKSINIK